MLRIERIKIEILTEDGIYGTDQEIHTGLNFLSSNNNTCGKSSILEAIYYGLGFEEIIGGKGEKVLTSVYKSKLQTGENCLDVYESRIYLQIYNGKEHVTIYRAAKCQNRDSNLVTVYYDTMDKISETCQVEDKYVHLKNAALSERGYHYFLEKFLHLSLPEVPASDGTQRKLYLQLLFSSMFIEQKHGWADLFSGTPILGIKDVKKRIVEYVLNLDTIDNERKKEKLKIKEKDITYRWTTLIDELFTSCKVENCEIMNLPLKPQLLTAKDIEKIHIVKNGTSLNGFINSLDNQIGLLNSIKPKVVDNFDDLQEELEETEKNILNFEEEPTRTLYERSKSAINRRFCYKCMRAILPISENSSFSALCIEKAAFKLYNKGIEKFLINFFRSEIFGYAKRTICIEDLNASWKEAYPVDDASIMDLFRKRDEKAIAEMKRKYDKLCYYVAGNILSQREDIEECVNSAYYEIWNNIPPDSPNDLKTYLCRIVRNIAIKRLHYNTAAKRNPEFTVPIDEIAECVPTTDTQNDDVLADAISRFLRTQDEKHRKVFVRRYWYGDTIAAIAEYYGMKEKTVATYLFRTRKKLKAFLQKEGYDYE